MMRVNKSICDGVKSSWLSFIHKGYIDVGVFIHNICPKFGLPHFLPERSRIESATKMSFQSITHNIRHLCLSYSELKWFIRAGVDCTTQFPNLRTVSSSFWVSGLTMMEKPEGSCIPRNATKIEANVSDAKTGRWPRTRTQIFDTVEAYADHLELNWKHDIKLLLCGLVEDRLARVIVEPTRELFIHHHCGAGPTFACTDFVSHLLFPFPPKNRCKSCV